MATIVSIEFKKGNKDIDAPKSYVTIEKKSTKEMLESGLIPTMGTGGNVLYQEDLSSQVDGIKTTFTTNRHWYTNSLLVFINGLKEGAIIILTDNTFTIPYAPEIGDSLEVAYNVK